MKQLFIIVLILGLNGLTIAQITIEDSLLQTLDTIKTIDNRFNTLMNLATYSIRYSIEKSRKYLETAKKIAKEQANNAWIAETDLLLARVEVSSSHYEEAENILRRCLAYYKREGDVAKISVVLNSLGVVYNAKGDYLEAVHVLEENKNYFSYSEIKNINKGKTLANLSNAYKNINLLSKSTKVLFESLKYFENTGDSISIGVVYNNLGILYYLQEKYETAVKYYEKALVIHENKNYLPGQIDALHNIAIIKNHQEDYIKELELKKKVLRIAHQLGAKNRIWMAKVRVASAYIAQKKYNEALKILDNLDTIEVQNNQPFIHHYYNKYVNIYMELKRFNQALYFARKSYDLSKRMGKNNFIAADLEMLHTIYSNLKQPQQAYQYLLEYQEIKDSLTNETNIETLTTERLKFDFEKEQEVLKYEKKVLEGQVRIQKIARRSLLSLLILLLFIGSFIFRYYKKENELLSQNLQNKEIIEFQARQLRIFNEELEQTVTERTKELEQANYELKTFNYIASHDIKEPIRNIGNYAGLIFRKLPDDLKHSFEYYFETIKNSTNQLYTLVEDFSRYTQLSKNNNLELQQSVDLNEIVDSLRFSLNGMIELKNGKIINKGLPIIKSNASLVYTILKNLIENGLKYNQSTMPTVSLTYSQNENYHRIHIQDNGIGIQAEYHEQIFEMFKRLHSRGEYDGSGIGLAIVKLLTDKLNVPLELESELGKGTTFTLLIPK